MINVCPYLAGDIVEVLPGLPAWMNGTGRPDPTGTYLVKYVTVYQDLQSARGSYWVLSAHAQDLRFTTSWSNRIDIFHAFAEPYLQLRVRPQRRSSFTKCARV